MTQIITNSNGGGGSGGSGDMLKSVYDPQNIEADAFDYNNFTNTPTIPAAQVQSDWNEADNTKVDYIKNKPNLSVYQTTANLVEDLDNADNTHYPSSLAVKNAITSAGGGDVSGPNSSTDGHLAVFDGTTGKLIKDSGASLSDYQTKANMVTSLSGADDTHYPTAKAVSDAISSSGGGDMLASVYDPDNIASNAFDYDNFINTPTIPTDTSDLTNGAGFITGINSTDVTTALGYTPYNSSNPSGYVTNSIISDTAYGSGWDSDTTHAPTKNAVYDKLKSVDDLIPSAATSSNQLADKDYVNDGINSVTAYYITKNAAGDQFATYAELSSASTFYSGGVVRTPTRNDYCIVQADENHDNATTRYIYNSSWEYQYTVNETALTTAQLNAINSGITSGKVSTYDGYASGKQDTLTAGTGIDITGTTISNDGVTSVNGQTGAVTVSGGADYSWVTKTISGGEVELGLRTIVNTPGENFTLTAPATLQDGEEYVIRVINEANYTMTLGTGFTNPFSVDLSLSSYATDQFVFVAVGGNLELQPLFNN